MLCLREASLGPVFGVKGGAAGGGYAQVVPMEDLNLHFTGDLHAITAANNLLAALIDAHLHHGNEAGIDPLSISWRRCMDMNDRNLRNVVTGLGGRAHGAPRETGFDITAASEIMALVAVARDLGDLRERLGRITLGETYEGEPVTAERIKRRGRDGRRPQGRDQAEPRADARGPARVRALRPVREHRAREQLARRGPGRAEARRVRRSRSPASPRTWGWRSSSTSRAASATYGRVPWCWWRRSARSSTTAATSKAGAAEIEAGAANLARHIGIVKGYGLQVVVGVNKFPTDTSDELELVRKLALEHGAYAAEINTAFEDGGAGATALAEAVVAAADEPNEFDYAYPLDAPIEEKIRLIATRVYGADGVDLLPPAKKKAADWADSELARLPICMAKTHLSLSHDPALRNAPTGFTVPIRDLRPYTGAGWLVALCGDMMTMPGLGKTPAAFAIDIDDSGEIVGLF